MITGGVQNTLTRRFGVIYVTFSGPLYYFLSEIKTTLNIIHMVKISLPVYLFVFIIIRVTIRLWWPIFELGTPSILCQWSAEINHYNIINHKKDELSRIFTIIIYTLFITWPSSKTVQYFGCAGVVIGIILQQNSAI